ncbi:hypothetical protein J5N97_011885 [Dioscorea zingiberensis]|uniref:Tyrosine decarboxylase n=1 Tax=Dioscorea zingiberensis TaxID=325984 RepID=A0A9D5D1C5_9LILI|nr:hypothetical protein J5N97_011885 [Dioscorea zingiberensis]
MLCGGFNAVGFNWIASLAATELREHRHGLDGQDDETPGFFSLLWRPRWRRCLAWQRRGVGQASHTRGGTRQGLEKARSRCLLVDSLSTNPEILRNEASDANVVVDYKDWQIALSRRFRAIKLWLVIRRYGVANLTEHIRSDVALAKHFEGLVTMDERFEVVVRRKFSLVCFGLKPKFEACDRTSELNRQLLEAINTSGRAFMTHAVVNGDFVIRFAIGTTLTEKRHVDQTWKLIQSKATDILNT